MKEKVFKLSTKEYVEVEIPNTIDEAINNRESLKMERFNIKNWLKDNDWIPNKIVVGEWATDDPRWTTYLNERTIKRARLDELNALLGE